MRTCTTCKTSLPEDMFAFRDKSLGIRSYKCKPCHGDYIKEWRKGNPTSQRKATKAIKTRKIQYLREARNRPCMDCQGMFHYVAMDFDHRPGTEKLFNPSEGRDRGWQQLKDEIAKCDVVCANCHRLRTYERSV